MSKLKNYEELHEELADMLRRFAVELNIYETVVELYFDEPSGLWQLGEHLDHSIHKKQHDIYVDKAHKEGAEYPFPSGGMLSWYQDVAELAEYAGVPENQFVKEIRDFLDEDDDFEPGWVDAVDYLTSGAAPAEYMERLEAAYLDALEEEVDFEQQARDILNAFEDGLELPLEL